MSYWRGQDELRVGLFKEACDSIDVENVEVRERLIDKDDTRREKSYLRSYVLPTKTEASRVVEIKLPVIV